MTLNPSQLKAVNTDAPLIVVPSGPGSGKTRTAATRTTRLLRAGHSVVVLTFTNAAAHEFRMRILGEVFASQTIHSVSDSSAPADFLTLHAYCWRLIRRFGHLIGYTTDGVSMLPPGDADELLEEVRDSLGVKTSISELHELHEARGGMIEQVWTEYRFRLKRNNLVDYDRILFDGMALLGLPEVRDAVAIDDLIVEEAQDSAAIDWSIYFGIPAANRFFIGDIDQAIFEFRAAYPEGFLNVIQSPESHVLPLEDNYRCAARICDVANRLIGHNQNRFEKQTISATGEKGVVTVEGFNEPQDEFVRMTELIAKHMAEAWPMKDGIGKSIAVLCRTNYGATQVRNHLAGVGLMAFQAHSRSRYGQPADWQRATLLTGLVVSPFNEVIIEQLLRLDHPKSTVNDWKLRAQAEGGSLRDRFPGAMAIDTREQFLHYLAVNSVSESTVALIQQRFELLPEDATVADLLQDLHSHDLPEQKQPADTIYVGTIHSAKGREFDVVFLPMFEESKATGSNVEEERRLAFVAVTRARSYVHISFSWKRKQKWGAEARTSPSRFIGEMGLALLASAD